MEYSLTEMPRDELRRVCLNPCSNGILSDTLTESKLQF